MTERIFKSQNDLHNVMVDFLCGVHLGKHGFLVLSSGGRDCREVAGVKLARETFLLSRFGVCQCVSLAVVQVCVVLN